MVLWGRLGGLLRCLLGESPIDRKAAAPWPSRVALIICGEFMRDGVSPDMRLGIPGRVGQERVGQEGDKWNLVLSDTKRRSS